MRVLAILATYNEERFIANCLGHLIRHGVDVYLMDNCSTDRTLEIAERYLKRGVIGIETLPRAGVFSLQAQMQRKEELVQILDADWYLHLDTDEVRLPPWADCTLAEAFARVEAEGYNAVNFIEYTFIPTRESPEHDHADYERTMRWYYPFLPRFPHRLNAWKRQPRPVEMAWRGGHEVRFPGLKMYPVSFKMRHYLILSVPHAIRKFIQRGYDQAEVKAGKHGWRAQLSPDDIQLPSQTELRTYTSDDKLDASNPRTQHYLADIWAAHQARRTGRVA